MSTKTSFKRLALGVVVAMGLGFFSSAPSVAVHSSPTLTLSGAGATSNTAVALESATVVTATASFFASAASDSMSIRAVVTTASGGSASVRLRATSDSSNVTTALTGVRQANCALADVASGCDVGGHNPTSVYDTMTVVTSGAAVKQSYEVQAYGFSVAGTYTITLGLYSHDTGSDPDATYASTQAVKFASFDVVVAAASTEPVAIKTYTTEFSAGGLAAVAIEKSKLVFASTDSAVVVSTGTAGTYTGVAYVMANLFASNNETRTGTAKTNICNTPCTVNVTIDRGYIDNARGNSPTASETISVTNSATLTTGESLVVYSAGNTAGVGTLTYRLAANGALLGTSTVTFTGTPASVSQMYSNDTITSIGTTLAGSRTLTLNAIVKDSGATTLKSGTVWVYSSDTKVAGSRGATSTTVAQSCSIGSTGVAACSVNINDTGTATLTIRDSHTVAASTWVSDGWVVTVTGETIKTGMTVAFDKTSYAPGERAVITITAKDAADRLIATNSNMSTVFTVDTNRGGYGYVTDDLYRGTQASLTSTLERAFVSYNDSGVETRVITMPTSTGSFTYGLRYTPFGATTPVTVSASTTVNDPAITALATTAAAAQAAADAATDAANEAIDAANAATDAANLSAEAADAATVAAEEARDAADAATAAVEELATQVATLMAALKAQITTLANTVAKIAKKVKA
jgi:trimeric autotransporter adhesin